MNFKKIQRVNFKKKIKPLSRYRIKAKRIYIPVERSILIKQSIPIELSIPMR